MSFLFAVRDLFFYTIKTKKSAHAAYGKCSIEMLKQMTKADYTYYDYIIAMDRFNLRNMTRFVGNDPDNKVSILMNFTNQVVVLRP